MQVFSLWLIKLSPIRTIHKSIESSLLGGCMYVLNFLLFELNIRAIQAHPVGTHISLPPHFGLITLLGLALKQTRGTCKVIVNFEGEKTSRTLEPKGTFGVAFAKKKDCGSVA
ncbi:hypothetical protein TWF718_005874 [Orbilia javanica]|uniref:Uncharacterized protein n=1 Tax=Orbilia javanica TaxID=47235 RepID=A0AAN8RDV7_9PEZI